MNSKALIISGIFAVIIVSSSYWADPALFKIPLIFYSLIIIITGLFSLHNNYNKKLYLIIVTPLLLLTWILDFIYVQSSSKENSYIIYIMNGIITLIFIKFIMDSLKKWNKMRKH